MTIKEDLINFWYEYLSNRTTYPCILSSVELSDDDIRALELIIKAHKNGLSTKDLVSLLSQREGVELININPHTEKNITICGPAIVLNIID